MRATAPGSYIHTEVGAGDQHKKSQYPFNKRAVKVGNTVIIRGKPARSNRGKRMFRRNQKIQAACPEHKRTGQRKNNVYGKKGQGHFFYLRQKTGVRRSRALGIEHAHGTLAETGKKGDKDNDNTQSSEPVSQRPPQK